jgi:hypothetical protein
MIVIIMLIHVVSFKLQLPACITIHNQCLGTMLAAPVYFCNGAMSPELFDQQIDIGAEVRTSFEIDTIKNKFESVLLFKLKRYVESNDQHDMDTSSIETDKNEATHIHILVIWEVKDAKSFAYVALVEDNKAFTWNEDRLKKLYDKNCDWLKKYDDTISDIWFLDDSTTLKMAFNLKDFELSISISEEERNDDAMRPLCVDPKR